MAHKHAHLYAFNEHRSTYTPNIVKIEDVLPCFDRQFREAGSVWFCCEMRADLGVSVSALQLIHMKTVASQVV
jgi:hypothetical protein